MKKNLGYTINWKTNTITMTKKFAEKANEYGTTEYEMLMDVKSKGFTIAVKEVKPRKACPTRITFKQMETILSCMDYVDERLAELHAVMDYSRGMKNPYEYVRKWFLLNYPSFYEMPVLDVNYRIVAPRLNLLPEVTEEMKKIA